MARIFPNKFPGTCSDPECKIRVKKGEGFVQPVEVGEKTVWKTWCADHVPEDPKPSTANFDRYTTKSAVSIFPNKYRKPCFHEECTELVEPGEGFIERRGEGDDVQWLTWCADHVPTTGTEPKQQREQSAFINEIQENPADNLPRLIYADWLEEQSDPKCEWIRVQCQLAESDFFTDYFQAKKRKVLEELWERETRLFEQYMTEWISELPGYVREWRYDRGMPEGINLYAEMFVKFGDQLPATLPLRFLKLIHFEEHAERIAEMNVLSRFTELMWKPTQTRMIAEATNAILKSPHLHNLQALDLGNNRFPAETLELLTQTRFPKLKVLGLRNCPLRENHINALLQWKGLGQIEELHLGRTGLSTSDVLRLIKSPLLKNLRILDLSYNDLIPDIGWELGETKQLQNLEHLDLSHNSQLKTGGEKLADAAFPKLRSLNVIGCQFSTEVAAIVRSRFREQLEAGRVLNELCSHVQGLFCSQRFQPKRWQQGGNIGLARRLPEA